MKNEKTFDLEDRLVEFAARCINVSDALLSTKAGPHLAGQLCRSGTSPALNYGEAQGAESRKGCVHKMSICRKELRESLICLNSVIKTKMVDPEKLKPLAGGADELISIFVKSIKTAKQNITEKKRAEDK